MILDTTFVIDLMNNEKEAVEKLSTLSTKGESIFITSLTIFEVFRGVNRSKKPVEERRKINITLENQLTLDFDDKSAEKAGEIDRELISEGKIIDPIDCMIAGIALVKKEKVLTRNIKDFSRISGLEVETY